MTASFAINTYTVTPTAGAGGTIAPSTPQSVNYNQSTSFTVTPNTGYHINTVSGCGGSLVGNTYTTGPITAACSVTASFAINTYTVTATAGSSGSLDCSTPTPVTVNYNATTAFKFNANTGYHVATITVQRVWGYTNTSNWLAYTYTHRPITAACSVTASFAINTYTVTPRLGLGVRLLHLRHRA